MPFITGAVDVCNFEIISLSTAKIRNTKPESFCFLAFETIQEMYLIDA